MKTFRPWTILCLVLLWVAPAGAAVHHDLRVSLFPETHRLSGTDEITLRPEGRPHVTLFLSPAARVRRVMVDGKDAAYRFSKGRLQISLSSESRNETVRISVHYDAFFDDPVPYTPANTDNPGYGVTGIVGTKGTFLLPGARWYPQVENSPLRMDIVVDAPEGITAVTAGRATGRRTEAGRTLSSWRVERGQEDLALCAGPYVVTEVQSDGVRVATYFFPETQPLSERYLAAATRYLKMYSDLFGPYPFEKFAVVENFFPTGYGFPSYTLMGTAVLRLPFILDVSLGHEIAHCWWGNGVGVDAGNWSEGLTTYVADYLYKEKESAEAARRYRQQWLRNYAALVDSNTDFPLSRFIGRVDPATKVIGYDKSAMVFHMLRKILGEDAFWGALRDIYREKLFQKASWKDFRMAFEQRAGAGPCCTLEGFFSQWVFRAGAPDLAVQNVSREKVEGSWQISGQVVQKEPVFDLPVSLRIETDSGPATQVLSLHGRHTGFTITVPGKPRALEMDPEVDLFRRLHPEEIPACVNTLKGASSVTVVIAAGGGRAGMETARMLVQALGLSRARIVEEGQGKAADIEKEDRVFVGFPKRGALVPKAPAPVRLSQGAIDIKDRAYGEATDTFFGVFPDPERQGTVAAILAPLHPELGPLVARKVTHYGQYSYLVFRAGKNVEKGTWPVTKSPMIFRWADGTPK